MSKHCAALGIWAKGSLHLLSLEAYHPLTDNQSLGELTHEGVFNSFWNGSWLALRKLGI